MAAFSPERLLKIRRMRKARRMFKRFPLFAFTELQHLYSGYSYSDFLDDLRRRTKKKKRRARSGLLKYGRYEKMQQCLRLYETTRDISFLREACRLRQRIAQPYRLLVKLEGKKMVCTYPAETHYKRMESFAAAINKHCKTWQEFERLEKEQNF